MPTGVYERTEEMGENISEAQKNSSKFQEWLKKLHESNIGKSRSKDTKERMSKRRKEFWQDSENRKRMSKAYKNSPNCKKQLKELHEAKKGKPRSEKIREKISEAERGEKGSNWKGGVTSLNKVIRQSLNFKLWRKSIFKRDNYTCQLCNKRSRQIFPHHIISFVEIRDKNNIRTFDEALNCEELWDINNGITLCEKCHKEFHKRYGWGNNTKEQLEEFLNKEVN